MRPKDFNIARRFDLALRSFDAQARPLPGIRHPPNREAFLEQLLESIHRINYATLISTRSVSPLRADPSSNLFYPLKAAILWKRRGQLDEAFWFVFLFVHFGKNARTGFALARQIYGALGKGPHWTWDRVSADPHAFRSWLAANRGRITGSFGNHRKYESLDANSPNGTGEAVESYVRWISTFGGHGNLILTARREAGEDSKLMFDWLYRSMGAVARFGRTAKFDFLTMVAKIGLAPIEPGSTYMEGATGPFAGACLLFGGRRTTRYSRADLDAWLVELGNHLGVGMQALEDSLCNWQKSPDRFVAFRG